MLVGPAVSRVPVRRCQRLSHRGNGIPPGTTACVPPADRPQSGHGSHRTIRPAPARPGARAQTDAIHDQCGRRRSAVRRSRSRSRLHYATTLSPHHRTSAAASQERLGRATARRCQAGSAHRADARESGDGTRIGTTCGPSTSIMPVAVKVPDRTAMRTAHPSKPLHRADLLLRRRGHSTSLRARALLTAEGMQRRPDRFDGLTRRQTAERDQTTAGWSRRHRRHPATSAGCSPPPQCRLSGYGAVTPVPRDCPTQSRSRCLADDVGDTPRLRGSCSLGRLVAAASVGAGLSASPARVHLVREGRHPVVRQDVLERLPNDKCWVPYVSDCDEHAGSVHSKSLPTDPAGAEDYRPATRLSMQTRRRDDACPAEMPSSRAPSHGTLRLMG